jgi:transcriptional regulator with XRE-family HTH domain
MGTSKPRLRYHTDLMVTDMSAKGWLATHLAAAAGVSAMTVSRFLSGHVQTAPTAKKLARALGRSIRRYLIVPDAVAL